MSTLAPHQQRVVDEKRELDTKLCKLIDFIEKPSPFVALTDREKSLLRSQRYAMAEYSAILNQRIQLFKE